MQFTGFGAKSLVMLRDSSYLFIRKVMPGAKVTGSYQGKPLENMVDAFEKLVYAETPVKEEEVATLREDQPGATEATKWRDLKHDTWSLPKAYHATEQRRMAAEAMEPNEVTGDLTMGVAQPEEFADNPISQTILTKVIADLCGVENWDVKVEITPSGRASSALSRYLRLNWGNVDASFTVMLPPNPSRRLTMQELQRVQDVLSKADLSKLTHQIYQAFLDQDHFDGSVKATSISLSGVDSQENRNFVAMMVCQRTGFMC